MPRNSDGPQGHPATGGDGGQPSPLFEAVAQLRVAVDQFSQGAAAAAAKRASRDQYLRQLYPLEIPAQTITATNQTIDIPDLLGPKDGYAWDIRFIRMGTSASSGSFGGGTVAVHKRQSMAATSADPNELFEATSVQSVFPGSGVWVLLPGDRLVLQSSGTINTTIMIYGSYILVPLPLLPDYLL